MFQCYIYHIINVSIDKSAYITDNKLNTKRKSFIHRHT